MLTEPFPAEVDSALYTLQVYASAMRENSMDNSEGVVEVADRVGQFESREHLDAIFRRLGVATLERDRFEVRDFQQQLLGVWHIDDLTDVVSYLVTLNAQPPGAATYVLRGDASIIRQWRLNLEHYSKRSFERRIEDLPGLVPASAKGKPSTAAGKAQLTKGLLDGISFS